MADKDTEQGRRLVKEQVISQGRLESAHKRAQESGKPWYRQLLQGGRLSFDAVSDALRYEFHSKTSRESHESLGDALVRAGELTKDQLDEALEIQRRVGRLLGDILLDKGWVTRETIAKVLSRQYGIPYIALRDAPSEQAALGKVPESVAKQKKFIPVKLEGDKLTVLIAGPQAPERMKNIGVVLGVRMDPFITAVDDIEAEIEERYMGVSHTVSTQPGSGRRRQTPTMDRAIAPENAAPAASEAEPEPPQHTPQAAETEAAAKEEPKAMATVKEGSSNRFQKIIGAAQGAPVIKLVSTIIEGAVNSGATDVHMDPQEPEMRVRYRIDGVLHDVMSIPSDIEAAVVSRLKIMADIDITENRHPQDGHISMEIGDREFDVRVATLPTFLGERVVLRLLDQSSVLSGIDDLGMEPDDEKKLRAAIEQPYGMVLVTGPTGSGKTTTLYSCLNEKDVMTDSIVTLEDPVEYQLSGINQVQIDPDIDLSFANVLRAALRQDIDVLLVGEIRDAETARIAVRAAMTGHLVFSTLHTNDAVESISTLRNMDVPSFLIANALTAVVAQRLVRAICPDCKKGFKPTKTLLKSLGLPESTKKLYRGAGCEACYNTGARGRTGVFEVLEITPAVRKLIGEDASTDQLAKAAKLKDMSDRCRLKLKAGVISPEEYMRVIRA